MAHRMGRLYGFLGMSVGVVQEHHSKSRRRAAFEADITYVTSNALGFTYLNDTSTAMSPDHLVTLQQFTMLYACEESSAAGGCLYAVTIRSGMAAQASGGCSVAEQA